MWEEIFLSNRSSKKEAVASSEPPSIPKKKEISLEEVLLFRAKIVEQLKDRVILTFEPAHFLSVKMNHSVEFFPKVLSLVSESYIPLSPVLYDTFSSLCEKILQFYQYDFHDDPTLLDILTNYLLFAGRLEEYKRLTTDFLAKDKLPIKHYTFLVCLGSIENTLHSQIVEEAGLIFTVYRFLYSQVLNSEKAIFYDALLSGRFDNLLSVGFVLFQEETGGIRNVFPILSRILKQNQLSLQEKDTVLSFYKSTERYMETFFLLKKEKSRSDIKEWLESVKGINGKKLPNLPEDIVNLNRPELLRAKFKRLKAEKKLYTLQPFEILLLLNSTEAFIIRDNIDIAYSRYPYSYIINRSKAVVHFFDNEFYSFFKHATLSGRFQFMAEMIYIKALSLIEVDRKTEGNVILYALQKKFPKSDFLKNALEEFKV
jgi:hypothetical protein